MKKITAIVLIAVLAAVLALTFASCKDSTPDSISHNYTDLAEDGDFVTSSGGAGDSAVFDFGKSVTLNALVLREKSNTVTSFRLYADDSDTAFYGNDFIEGYRYCAFDEITLTKLRIEIPTCEGEWKLDSLEAYDIKENDQADDFRIMSYITVESILSMDGEEYKDNLALVTQFNVFGSLYLDKDGNIVFENYEKDGEAVDGKEAFAYALDFVRKYNPTAEITATVLGNKDMGDGLDVEERHSSAMGDNREKFISSIKSVISDFSLDGISFDYEYPYKYSSYKIYKSFLKELDKALPSDCLITAAISEWQLRITMFTASSLEVLDQIEVMSYDMFDDRGNHSTFYTGCYKILEKFRSKGVDMSKINVGIPFYSRPVDAASFWGNYKDVADKLSPWENSYVQSYVDLDGKEFPPLSNYYNGIQLVTDKTLFALDSGVGGVMIWHFACDTSDPELSLMHNIAKAIESRKA